MYYGNLIVEKTLKFHLLSYTVFSLQYSVLLLFLSRQDHYSNSLSLVTGKLGLLPVQFLFYLYLHWSNWYGIVALDKWSFFRIETCLYDLQSDILKCIVLGFLEICKGFIRCRIRLEYLASLCILNDLELHCPREQTLATCCYLNLNSNWIMLSKIKN